MKHLIVYAHPTDESFNHAVLQRSHAVLSESGDCEIVDLYQRRFDPIRSAHEHRGDDVPPDVERQQRLVADADHLVFVFPIWWYDRPAILKGWCDRVLRRGFAYRFDTESGAPVGQLGGKTASVIVTSGLITEGDPSLVWATRSMTQGTLKFCGIADTALLPLFAVPRVSEEARTQMLTTVGEFLRSRTPATNGQRAMNQPDDIRSFYAQTMRKAPAAIMQWYLTLNQRDAKGLRATMTDDFTFHSPLGNFDTPEGYVEMVGAFGGWVETKRLVVEGTAVVHEFVYHMTDPATADIPMLEIFDMKGDRIQASTVYNNPADFPSP